MTHFEVIGQKCLLALSSVRVLSKMSHFFPKKFCLLQKFPKKCF